MTDLETRVRRGLEALADTCESRRPALGLVEVPVREWVDPPRRVWRVVAAAAVAVTLVALGIVVGQARDESQSINPRTSVTDSVASPPSATEASSVFPTIPNVVPVPPTSAPPPTLAPGALPITAPAVDPNSEPFDIAVGGLALTAPSGWASSDYACLGAAHTIVVTNVMVPCPQEQQSDSFIWIETSMLDLNATGCERAELNGLPGCWANWAGFTAWALEGANVTLLYFTEHDPAVDEVLLTLRLETPRPGG